MKTKYRIVAQPSPIYPDYTWYQAQYKLFNLFWLNCDCDVHRPGLSRSMELNNVEERVDALIHNKWKNYSKQVVRVYE